MKTSGGVDRLRFDVIVVGSGASGSRAAAEAAQSGARVCIVSKDPVVCSDSKISEGIITVRGSGSAKDSVSELKDNLRVQGDDLGREAIVAAFAGDSADSYAWLQAAGLHGAETGADGKPRPLSLPMGGHTRARSIPHANGGLDHGHALSNAIWNSGKIEIFEDAWFLDVYIEAGDPAAGAEHGASVPSGNQRVVRGGLVYHAATGRFVSLVAPSVVLACGGLSSLYFPDTDTMRGNTGDSYALAARAGALLADMEQIQFLPFGIAHPPSFRGLLAGEPVSAGALGVLRDASGRLIQGELMARTRAELAAAISQAVAAGRGTEHGACYLDMTGNGRGKSGRVFRRLLRAKVPGIMQNIRRAMGPRAANFEEYWEIKPTAHYCMGGVLTTRDGEALAANPHSQTPAGESQKIHGLFVCGQAMGGLHGSNRLGSTSLAECLVFGRRAGAAAGAHARDLAPAFDESALDESAFAALERKTLTGFESRLAQAGSAGNAAPETTDGQTDQQTESARPYPLRLIRRLQNAVRSGLGPARTGTGIDEALHEFDAIAGELNASWISPGTIWNQGFLDYLECQNMLLTARLVGASARLRGQSTGAHLRLDSPAVTSGRLPRAPYSVSVALDMDRLQIVTWPDEREPSPRLARIRIAIQKGIKIAVLRLLRNLPFFLVDRILTRMYTRALGADEEHPENHRPAMADGPTESHSL